MGKADCKVRLFSFFIKVDADWEFISKDMYILVSDLFKAKIVTPVRTPKVKPEGTSTQTNLSASKNKYSHVKSTIPRLTVKKN